MQSEVSELPAKSTPAARLRRFPYPYRAMLAICSDLDGTRDARAYFEIMRLLNTHDETPMGTGVGVEVGNSIYFDMPADEFSYWNTDEAGREMFRALMRSGHVDCLHSYGTTARTRSRAGKALEELARHDCKLSVWVDHGKAPTNLDPYIMEGHGDEPGHSAYHADLTTAYGIRYVSRGRVTSVIGQGRPASLCGIADWKHPVRSVGTLATQAAKQFLAHAGNRKYAPHCGNHLTRPVRLRDGQEVCEFMRCNPHFGGVSCGDRGDQIHEVITPRFLDRLVDREGLCILYTHLGKLRGNAGGGATMGRMLTSFRLLADYFCDGQILVTTVRRLLDYWEMVNSVRVKRVQAGDHCLFEVSERADAESGGADRLNGLTIYLDEPIGLKVQSEDGPEWNWQRNGADHTGQKSVSIPWKQLEFPRWEGSNALARAAA